GTTAHIERFIIPKNADPTRTHLNRRLIEYPDGVKDRSAAIQRRLEEAGLTRKIGSNQVRAIRINVSGTHKDMKRIEEEGRLDEWCADNLKYFADTFGKENIVAAHLHRDEETPHIHVTLVPIVKGERKRRKREEQTKKRYRKKPTDTVRLCADDIMTRLKLKSYQDTYRRAKKEIQTEKLKGAATTAATNIAESVGSLFGSNKVKALERENTALHRKIADHEETIEALQDRIQTMQADHSREIREMQQKHSREITDKDTRHKQEISFLKTVIAKAAAWFPYFREMLRIENLCRLVGFDERQTATLVKGKPLEYAGELYSEEHGRKFTTEKAGFQVVKDPTRLVLAIDRKPIAEWFKEQFDKLRQNIRRPIQPQRKSRGMKI
uniref:MobV family relaxase n=1 Tax=Bacteroides uniformis TaxID=820 RepID=UPI0022E952FC